MKRLPPRPPTAEDLEVWALVIGRFAVSNGEYYTRMWTDWRLCDRRDADLLLHAQRHKIVAAVLRTDDQLRIDLRQGAGIMVGHLALFFEAV